ncbi:MAG: PKD domain-containing protein [Ferruginibacter sp.]
MKTALLTILLFMCCLCTSARHIKGGFFTYQYLGPGISDPAKLRYKITLTVYMDCSATGLQVDGTVNFTVFNGTGPSQYANVEVPITNVVPVFLTKQSDDPCITGDQTGCYYRIASYELNGYELPVSPGGYTVSYQRCCRIEQMENISGSDNIGNTYTIQIPGTSSAVANANQNSSPTFPVNDTAVICQNIFFTYPFSAIDPEGDSLSYSLCTSFIGANQTNPTPATATAPPYSSVPYSSNFNGSAPMGSNVTINPKTGLISGIAPSITTAGEYAVTVCVSEFRNGLYIGDTRKELHIRVRDCSAIKAHLDPVPTSCDGFSLTFKNDATDNISGINYLWNFGDTASGILNNTATSETPTHTYSDTGTYTLKLRVTSGGQCADSSNTIVKIYPGFFPGFKATAPLCQGAPVKFTDTTKAKYGTPTGWRWDFGILTDTGDSSNAKDPLFVYPDSGTYNVQLIVGSTFGCIDTVVNTIRINTNPTVNLIPHDTLICFIDTLQLKTTNTGSFLWSPSYNISSLTSANPFVSPDIPTKYFVSFTDGLGCKNIDSVFVDVKMAVTIDAGNDTIICRTDGLLLNTTSDALHFIWTPSTYLSSDTARHPFANPLAGVITYHVVGNIGKCRDSSDVKITTFPYPPANAGNDTTVCFGFSVPLMATGGTLYQWSPATFLSATNIRNPIAVRPTATTQYIVAVRDGGGCPKPALDTVIVNVDPLVMANAGPADTTVVLGEPLFLNGTGGSTYLWQPATWLSNPAIANPIASPENNITYQLLVTSEAGCQNRDSIRIKLYKVPPSFYVPTAFTPNNDNNNDILKPILLGMRSLNYFRVFDRWGKLVFYTNQKGQGWDGTFKGNPQDPGTYVWMAEGATYTGEVIIRKGYSVLIR